MIRNTIIKCSEQFISKNINKYCFTLGNYLIPKSLTTNNRKLINIETNRNNLLKNQSPYSLNMKSYLENNNIKFIQEFIVIIQNPYLWNDIIASMNLPIKEYNDYKNINYFSLDYFLEDSLTCIEIDSDYHKNRENLDKARDLYLEVEYAIKTFRFYHFREDNINDDLLLSQLNVRISNIINNNLYHLFNYRDVVLRDFLYNNEFFIEILENFVTFIGSTNFYRLNKFTITEKDYLNFSENIKFIQGTEPIDYYKDFINFTKDLFNKEITIVKGIQNYSINDIYYILDNNKNNEVLITEIILPKLKGIPYWISNVILIPSIYKKYVSIKTIEDELIISLCKKLRFKKA